MKRLVALLGLSLFFLPLIPASAALRYTALGASDARGVGASDYPNVPNNGYVYRIHSWLQARYSPWELRNRGVSNYTAQAVRDNTLQPAIDDKPQMVTVWVGANELMDAILQDESVDSLKTRFEAAYTVIIQRLRQETGAFIVTADLPDMSRMPIAQFGSAEMRQKGRDGSVALNEVIYRVAAQYNVPVVDLNGDERTYNPANTSSDYFHPSDTGYQIMAEKYEAILQAQAWRLVSGLGDVDGNGTVNAADATAALRIAGGLELATNRQSVAVDVAPIGGDANASVADAIAILRRVAGLTPDGAWR